MVDRFSSRAVLLALLVVLAIALGTGPALAQTGSTLSGRVVDAVTNAPLAGCRVFLFANGSWGTVYVDTDVNGTFEFAGLPAGEYSTFYWMISDPSHFDWTSYHDRENMNVWETVTIEDDSSNVALLDQHIRPFCQIKGRVTLAANGDPASAHVSAWKWNGSGWTAMAGADTGLDGGYQLIVEPGTYRLGFDGATLSPTVWPDQAAMWIGSEWMSAGQDVTVAEAGEVRSGVDQAIAKCGDITTNAWASGSADYLSGGTVYLYYLDPTSDSWSVWDSGPFGTRFSGLPVGPYRLYYFGQPGLYDCYYSSALFASMATTIPLTDGAFLNVDNQMFGPSHLSGRALSATSSAGVEGIQVRAEIWDGSAWVLEASDNTAADGSWGVLAPPGRYRLLFGAPPSTGLDSRYYTGGGSVETSFGLSMDATLNNLDQALLPIDVAPPTTSAQYYHGWSSGSVAVSLSATDGPFGSGVASTWYKIGASDSPRTYAPGTTFDVTDEGTTTVYFGSVDNAGHHEADQSAVVRIDRTQPAVTPSVVNAGGKATVSLVGSDSVSGVSGIYYRVDSAAHDATYTVPLQLGVGAHTVEYYAMDQAGNESNDTVLSVNVAIQRVTPRLTKPAVSPSKPRRGKSFSISGRIATADSMASRVVLTIQRKVGSKFKPYATVRVTLSAGRLTYITKRKISKSGTYRVRASHTADAAHFAGVSLWRGFSVK